MEVSVIPVNTKHGLTYLKAIRAGKYQIVILSPELMKTKEFITNVIRHPDMQHRVFSVVIDEAHVISHWGSGFRKDYGTLGIFKALFPRGTPFVAMSATLPARVRDDVLTKLQFDVKDYEDIDEGNDRKNVSIVVRAMHHPMNTYRDLRFVIPEGVQSIDQVKKTFIYADSIAEAEEIENYLYSLCPKELREQGFIRPYSAAYPQAEYRNIAMEKFKGGEVRVLICTDAAGMVGEPPS